MAINLQSVIAAIEAKAAAADSTTPISDLYKIIIEANEVGIPMGVYDSAGVMPIDSAYVGSVFSTPAGGLYVLDSAGGSWQTADGSPTPIPFTVQGTQYGYQMAGWVPAQNVIDKFPFPSDANATDVGDLTVARYDPSAGKSATDGYVLQGYPSPTGVVDKFSFASGGNAVSPTTTRYNYGSSYSQDESNIFLLGGNVVNNTIDKFATATETNTTGVGSLVLNAYDMTGNSSSTNGYSSGGATPTQQDTIQKFPFAITSGSSTDVGNLIGVRSQAAGASSDTHGYLANGSPTAASLQKFPFASDGNAASVGTLAFNDGNYSSGNESTDNGYSTGAYGNFGGATSYGIVQKWPFASDNNAVGVGVLSVRRFHTAGVSY